MKNSKLLFYLSKEKTRSYKNRLRENADKILPIMSLILIIILIFQVRGSKDLSAYCNNRGEGEEKYECLLELAHVTLDESLCNRIQGKEEIAVAYREKCFSLLAATTGRPKLCEKIEILKPWSRDQCYLLVSRAVKDPAICELMFQGGSPRENCHELTKQ